MFHFIVSKSNIIVYYSSSLWSIKQLSVSSFILFLGVDVAFCFFPSILYRVPFIDVSYLYEEYVVRFFLAVFSYLVTTGWILGLGGATYDRGTSSSAVLCRLKMTSLFIFLYIIFLGPFFFCDDGSGSRGGT